MNTLDKTRPYATIRGRMEGGARFQQDGRYFKGSGEPVDGQGEPGGWQAIEALEAPLPESEPGLPADPSLPTRVLIPQIPEIKSEDLRQLLIFERTGSKRQTVIDAAQKELRRRMIDADEDS